MKLRTLFLIPLIALLISIPALSAQAQDDNPPPPQYDEMDDEFINALVMASVNHDLLAGKNELGEFNALNEIVSEYYNSKLNSAFLSLEEREKLTEMRDNHLSKIGKKIVTVKRGEAKNWLITLFDFFTDLDFMKNWDPDPYVDENETDPRRIYAEEDNLPDSIERLENAVLWTDFGKTVNAFLNVATISALPSLGPEINDSSGWSYNIPAITDSTGGNPIIGGNDSSPSQNGPDSGNGDQTPSLGNNETQHKSLRFTNNGFEPVTVVVETYEPAQGLNPGIPAASTVVSPETNSSAYLELPLGTYTFCYYWQLDEDYNNDDYFDYHHRTTSAYTLNNNSSNDMQSAIAVGLSPDSNVSNPNGKCGEVVTQDNSDLTPEEQANQGTHQWLATCVGNDEYCDGTTEIVTGTFTFSNGTAIIDDGSEESDVLVLVGLNTYTWTTEYDVWTYVFTKEGFELSVDFTQGKLVYTLQD